MKKNLLKLSSIALFFSLTFTSTFAGSIDLKEGEKQTISQDNNTESIEVKERAELTISSAKLTVRGQDKKDLVDIKDRGMATVDQNGTLIIYGDVILKDEAQLNILGKVIIYGNLQLKGDAKIIGSGDLVVTGNIERKDETSITGVKVSKQPAVITSIDNNLNVELTSGEKATIGIYNLRGQLLSSVEKAESTQIDLTQIGAQFFEVLIVRVEVGQKVYSSKIIKM